MLVLQKDEHMTGWKAHSCCGGYSCSAPQHQPSTALLPPKAWAERGSRASAGTQLQGAWVGAIGRPEPNPLQRVSYERGTYLEAKGSCLVGLWLRPLDGCCGSRSIPCSCSMLWHRARFWEQSWLQGPLGTGHVQGCAAVTGATSYIPTRALEMGAPQDQGHQERWKSLWKGVGEEAAAQEHRGLQVPAREQIQCAGCWLWGRAGC